MVAVSGQKDIGRINALIKDMLRSPYEGIGKPEPLRGNWSGWWSRRIDDTNRIVYTVIGFTCRYADQRGDGS